MSLSSCSLLSLLPPPAADSLFALSDFDLDMNPVSMCQYRGDVLLIVNAAEA